MHGQNHIKKSYRRLHCTFIITFSKCTFLELCLALIVMQVHYQVALLLLVAFRIMIDVCVADCIEASALGSCILPSAHMWL